MLAGFADGAIVRDEGQERRGLAAIREWMEETERFRVARSIFATSLRSMPTRSRA
jgi:hypothetical protein